MNFKHFFDRIAVVYLPEQKKRHRSMQKQVNRLEIEDKIQCFEGLKFEDKGQFPKASVRGCVMSNYELLRQAAEEKVERLLMFQEACVVSERLIRHKNVFIMGAIGLMGVVASANIMGAVHSRRGLMLT